MFDFRNATVLESKTLNESSNDPQKNSSCGRIFDTILFYEIFPDQILGAYGPKLRVLELTGPRLRRITMDAFEGIDSYELLLAIRDTRYDLK